MNIIRPMLFSYLSFLVYTITFIFYEDKKWTFKFRLKKNREGLSPRREKTEALIEMDNPIDRWLEWDNIERCGPARIHRLG
jgi:hypothetical protein